MAEDKVKRRDQVKELIALGSMTKAEIADKLEVSVACVSSQMTYLRWMGNFIKYDEDKVLSFVTEEVYEEWQKELKANRKGKATSTRTPEEQAVAIAKTITSQETSMAKWNKKLEQVEADLEKEPDDEELEDLKDEAEANITLLRIKLKRNKAKAEDLPGVAEEVAEEVVEESDDADEVEDEELL